ncbi:MAG: prenyltransferase/squalene oxidase repeat-containing protein [Flavobacteriales bacterium]
MLASLLDYARCFAHGLVRRDERALLGASLERIAHAGGADPAARQAALAGAIDWLCLAQDQWPDGGIGSYHLVNGWGAPYPETTGYIVPTLLAAARVLERPSLCDRALRAGEWLLRIQRPDGGWQGGRVDQERLSIVFNTAQVVRGLLALHAHGGDDRFADAAERAGAWILSVQEADGAWRTHNFLGAGRVYDTYVDAPLLALWKRTGDDRFRAGAVRNLAWVLERQHANGWFSDADNTLRHNDRPITHTIAYTMDGLIACGEALSDERLIAAARKPADALLRAFLRDGRLNGRYDASWRGSEAAIITGCAQSAIVWSRLAAITSDDRYAEGVRRMTAWLIGVQARSGRGPAGVHGALPGSFPLWGRYEKFAFPNWATKYFADALLCGEERSSR